MSDDCTSAQVSGMDASRGNQTLACDGVSDVAWGPLPATFMMDPPPETGGKILVQYAVSSPQLLGALYEGVIYWSDAGPGNWSAWSKTAQAARTMKASHAERSRALWSSSRMNSRELWSFSRMPTNDAEVGKNCTPPVPPPDTVAIYLGDGCFWERQWAYFVVETDSNGPFNRKALATTSRTGYAGGALPSLVSGKSTVCYHTGDSRDYSLLGHAEVVEVLLESSDVEAQTQALARDFFESFNGPDGKRSRPDMPPSPAMDAGPPYRSVLGLPGGMGSPLFSIFAQANTHGMALKPGKGGDADELNTVWVYDSLSFSFSPAEVYHQMHSNFFQSAGMPYPSSYVWDLWQAKQDACQICETGCPESVHN